jgi:hypothetical protein
MKRFIEGLALCAVVYVIIMGAGMLLSDADTPVHSADCYAHCAVCLHDNDCKTPISAPPGTQPFNGRVVDPDTQPQGLPSKLPMLMVPTDGEPVFFVCVPVHRK